MNRIAAITLFFGSTLLTAGSAAAQGNAYEVNVPFNFTVNNALLPAGSYTIEFDLIHPDTLVIRDQTKCVKAKDFGQRGTVDAGNPRTLVFHHYGDQYFLSEVRFESGRDGIYLPATRSERQARKVRRQEGLASVAGTVPQSSGNRSVQLSGKRSL